MHLSYIFQTRFTGALCHFCAFVLLRGKSPVMAAALCLWVSLYGFAFAQATQKVVREGHNQIFLGAVQGGLSFKDWIDIVAAHKNPALSRRKLSKVFRQLKKYSGKTFNIIPRQTNQIGLAKSGGHIMIDISVVGKPIEILAFWLAHEWAHHDLGHTRNRFTTPQMTLNALLRRRIFPTASEDEADIWAARFMAHHGYNIARVLNHFCEFKPDFTDFSHSSWGERAFNIARVYQQVTGLLVVPKCTNIDPRFRQVIAQNQFQVCQSCQGDMVQKPYFVVPPSFRRWCLKQCLVQ